jgi:hypothetical protein
MGNVTVPGCRFPVSGQKQESPIIYRVIEIRVLLVTGNRYLVTLKRALKRAPVVPTSTPPAAGYRISRAAGRIYRKIFMYLFTFSPMRLSNPY